MKGMGAASGNGPAGRNQSLPQNLTAEDASPPQVQTPSPEEVLLNLLKAS